MSVEYCHDCDKNIDTDVDLEHECTPYLDRAMRVGMFEGKLRRPPKDEKL